MNQSVDGISQPTPELPPPIGPRPSPFWPRQLWNLFFRPRKFFSNAPALEWKPALLLTLWAYGVSSVVEGIDRQAMRGNLQVMTELGILENGLTWDLFWIIAGVGGAISGAFLWWVGGWWYRVRLRLSDAKPDPDKRTARLLMIYSSFIFGGPLLVLLAVWTTRYANYDGYWADDPEWGSVVLAVCVFYSLWVSYAGVTSLYQVSIWKARAWFLILPAVYYVIVIALVIVVVVLATLAAPDLDNPHEHTSTVTFSYPGNWELSVEGDLTVSPPQDAEVRILTYVSNSAAEEELASSMASFEGVCESLEEQATFSELGSHAGSGTAVKCRLEGSDYTLRIFVADTRPVVEVREIWLPEDEPTLLPGLELIRETLKLVVTESDLLGAEFLETAEAFRTRVKAEHGVDLEYDLSGVRWLDEHINAVRDTIPPEELDQLVYDCGSFLGEAIVRTYGATWVNNELVGWALELPGGAQLNVFGKVRDQIENGEADSVLFFFQVLKSFIEEGEQEPVG